MYTIICSCPDSSTKDNYLIVCKHTIQAHWVDDVSAYSLSTFLKVAHQRVIATHYQASRWVCLAPGDPGSKKLLHISIIGWMSNLFSRFCLPRSFSLEDVYPPYCLEQWVLGTTVEQLVFSNECNESNILNKLNTWNKANKSNKWNKIHIKHKNILSQLQIYSSSKPRFATVSPIFQRSIDCRASVG